MAHEELKLFDIPSVIQDWDYKDWDYKDWDDEISMEWCKFNSVIMNIRSLLNIIINLLQENKSCLNTEGQFIINKLNMYINTYQISELSFIDKAQEKFQEKFQKKSNPNEELIRRTKLNFANKDAIAEYLITEEESKKVDFHETLIISYLYEYNRVIKTAAESFYDKIIDYIDYYEGIQDEGINEDLNISSKSDFKYIANSRAVDLYSLQDEIKNIIDFCDRYS